MHRLGALLPSLSLSLSLSLCVCKYVIIFIMYVLFCKDDSDLYPFCFLGVIDSICSDTHDFVCSLFHIEAQFETPSYELIA